MSVPCERRSSGLIREVPILSWGEPRIGVDRLVTYAMLVWAVSIFAGMSYLAAVI